MNSDDDIELDPLFPRARSAGSHLRRAEGGSEADETGQRTIRHEGAELTELRSLEDERGTIQHQELLFFGFAVEYRHSLGLRTGAVAPAPADAELPTAEAVRFDASPVLRVLELSARLLREARRDYYVQHLLGHVNDALTKRFGRPQTQVFGLPRWRDRLRRASSGLRRLHEQRVQVMILVGIGMAVGALATLAILSLVP